MVRNTLLGMLAASVIALAPATIGAAEPSRDVMLFKVVTINDTVVVGWTRDEISAMGRVEPISVVSSELQRAGQLPVWQYASRKDKDGELKMTPLRRIVIFSSGTARVEPFSSPLPVLPPS